MLAGYHFGMISTISDYLGRRSRNAELCVSYSRGGI